ncbi:MAG: chemotaxis protein CheW [Pyrinomonadaceae bacterium]
MTDLTAQLPPEIDFSAFDFTNITNSFLNGEESASSVSEKYLIFFLDGESYAVASKQVAEAAPMLPIAKLPNAPEWLAGIANLRNEIITVVNLSAVLKKQRAAAPKSKLIVLHSPNSVPSFAFLADRLSEIVSLQDKEIKRTNDENAPYIFGTVVHLSGKLNLIDTEKILSSLTI